MSRIAAILTAVALTSLACGDSTGVEPGDLAGTWTASSFTFTSVANPSTSVNLVGLGGTVSMAIQSSGAVTLTFSVFGQSDVETGTMTVTGSNVSFNFSGDVVSGTISRDGNTVTVNLTQGLEFDFDDDGTDEPATATAVFVKS